MYVWKSLLVLTIFYLQTLLIWDQIIRTDVQIIKYTMPAAKFWPNLATSALSNEKYFIKYAMI